MEKIKAGIFDGPQIRKLIKDSSFDDGLNPAELSAWLSLKSVIANFLGNYRIAHYQKETPTGLPDWLALGNEKVIPKMSDLMISHQRHWKNVRRSWKNASAAADARYEQSAVLLKELFRI
ncbi:Protein LIN37 [Trinorchestia longiramus]|nr:Protein LIN37 [Trinorchestia longiramus]